MPVNLDAISDVTVLALGKALQGTTQQQQAHAANLANAETPGYRAQRVSFEEDLRQALAAPPERQAAALEALRPQVTVSPDAPLRRDGNNVDLEGELLAISEAGLRYRVVARLLGKKNQMIRQALGGSAQ
ncbi:MAG TPA: flagellar basal body rod protein FlgB [Armatimonadota bacterium]|jgi:flagellar basal-body rod protein FlgB